MMKLDHFSLDVIIFVIFVMLVIGIQVAEYFWAPEVGWQLIGRIKHIYIYPIEGGCRKEVDQVDCSKSSYGLSFSDSSNNIVWKDRKYLIYTSESKEPEDKPLEESETLKNDQTPSPEDQKPEENKNPEEGKKPEPIIDLHNADFITMRPNILKYIELDKVRTVKYPDGTITYIRDCGYGVASILSKICGKNDKSCRLGSQSKYVRSLVSKSRKPNRFNKKMKSFNYLNPEFSMCSLVNEESVQDLKLISKNDNFTHLNFRPNFVIEATSKYCEDQVVSLKIGAVHFKNILPCAVGEYVNIDPEAGITYPHNQPYLTLLEKRKLKDVRPDISSTSEIPVFGITLDISSNGKVTIGDQVFARFRRSHPF